MTQSSLILSIKLSYLIIKKSINVNSCIVLLKANHFFSFKRSYTLEFISPPTKTINDV